MEEEQLGFESQFSSVMQNVLKSAVCEATRLFERTVRQLNAELVHLREENENLKSSALTPHYRRRDEGPKTEEESAKRDAAVQCDKPTVVERCCSPAQFGDPACSCASDDGNRQLALLLIKKEPQETDCDEYTPGYFLLKQEGAEPILVRKDPFKKTLEKVELPSALRDLSRSSETSNPSPPETSASCSFPTLTTSSSRCKQARQETSAATRTARTLSDLHASSAIRPADVLTASKPGLMTAHRNQQTTPNNHGDEFGTLTTQQMFHNVQNSQAVMQLVGPKLGQLPFPPNKNPVTGTIPVTTTTNKIPQPAPVAPPLLFSQAPKHALSQPQNHNMTVLGHLLGPRPQVSFSTTQQIVMQGQTSLPQSQVPPVHGAIQPVHPNLPALSQPNYSINPVPFAPPFLPVQSTKSSPSVQQISTSSDYEMLSDPLCSSSEAMFQAPDNTDLLQSLAPVSVFQSPVLLPQQETTNMINPQSSCQALQLAPLLTPKERQEAVCNPGNLSKTGPGAALHVSIPASNGFEQIARFQPLQSPVVNPPCAESIDDDNPAKINVPSEHYTVLSKPGASFTGPDLIFRMNLMKDLQADQKQTSNATCQVWDSPQLSDFVNVPVQKSARKVLEKKTECSECGRILSNPSSLENHMRLHRGERPYTCSQCGKSFPSVRGLNRHLKVHAEERGHTCEVCGRSFVYQFTLTKHKLIHSGDRPFPCKVCGKKFLAKADRATHMRMHTGEKPFFCTQCGKSFKHRVALNMHMQGHRGEKRYVCPHCQKGFVDLGNFKRHKRIHTGEKPFECKVCGKRFTQSAHLKKHVNTQHLAQRHNTHTVTDAQITAGSVVLDKREVAEDSGEPVGTNNISDMLDIPQGGAL